jgi:Na+-driven multidrug efflux pump
MLFPALVMTLGAVFLIVLSPILIFGWGPVPALGIAGGAIAFVLYYLGGTLACVAYLWSGRTVLSPPLRPPDLRWGPMWEILRVGIVSSLVSVTTNVTIAFVTGFAGLFGAAAVAGYGTGARLEYLLVPLVFGLGAPVGAMVGTAIGAGNRERALRVAWTGALIAGGLTEAIGIAAAIWPQAWLGLFGDDPAMIETGSSYLRLVGPFYGAFGVGLALYFASQGAGRVGWPLVGGVLRLVVAAGGGWLAIEGGFGLAGVFLAVGIALLVFPAVNAAAILLGAWSAGERMARQPAPAE